MAPFSPPPDFGLDSPPGPIARQLALTVTSRVYAQFPELDSRYGPSGREKADRDDAYLVQWAIDAARFGSASTFLRNVRWLADVLQARQFPAGVFDRTLEIVRETLAESGEVDAAALALVFDTRG